MNTSNHYRLKHIKSIQFNMFKQIRFSHTEDLNGRNCIGGGAQPKVERSHMGIGVNIPLKGMVYSLHSTINYKVNKSRMVAIMTNGPKCSRMVTY